jgi:hypothetical protein
METLVAIKEKLLSALFDREIQLSLKAAEIVESQFAKGHALPWWKHGYDEIAGGLEGPRPVKWTRIACSQCGSQVYFDLVMRRHRCSECSYGF